MSFQAYLTTVEKKTGLTPRQILHLAEERGFGPGTKAGEILTWLKEEWDLGRGHGMAMVHVITKGDRISPKHVDTGTAHSDSGDRLWLDGVDSMPEDW